MVATQFTQLSSPVALRNQRWPMGTEPYVTILCLSYNHERFIQDTIESLLDQETSFPVQIVIHDDASSDCTVEIVMRYVKEYPGFITPVLQNINQYSQNCGIAIPIIAKATGNYIAFCEGDDYWTGSLKVQSQVLALECRPDASGCIHRADGMFEDTGEVIAGFFGPDEIKAEYTVDDFLVRGNFAPTASVMLRNAAYLKEMDWARDAPHTDYVMLIRAAMEGPLLYLDESMSVYRKHSGGVHTGQDPALRVLRGLQSHFHVGASLNISQRPSFRLGQKFWVGRLEEEIERLQTRVENFEAQHLRDQETIRNIMQSKTFKVGRMLSRMRDRIVLAAKRARQVK